MLHGLINGTAHDIQIRAATGSDTKGSWSATSTVSPTDIGDTRSTSRVISPDTEIGGTITSSDSTDVFRVNLTAAAELVAYTTGDLDSIGELLDSSGDLLVYNDDGQLMHGPLNFMVGGNLQAGTYYISVTAWRGQVGDYTLHVVTVDDTRSTADAQVVGVDDWAMGVITSDTDVDFFQVDLAEQTDLIIRSAGRPYDTVGEVLDSDQMSVASGDLGYLPANWSQFLIQARFEAGTYYVKVNGASGADGPYALYVEEVTEPGSSISEAIPLVAGRAAGGQINPSTDSDYFRIDVGQGSLIMFRAVSESVEIDGDLLNEQGNSLNYTIHQEDLPGGSFGFALYGLSQGTYYLKVTGSGGTETGSYALLVFEYFIENRRHNLFRTTCKTLATDFDDPLYGCQWHLNNTGQLGGTEGEDSNVEEVWDNYLGTGVNVAVVDDALFDTHEDLTDNIDRSRSYSYIGEDDFGLSSYFSHGTEVAGVIAARDNSVGVRGVAPRATLYGYNYLSDPTVANRLDAMTRNLSTTAVSNNSWGLGRGRTQTQPRRQILGTGGGSRSNPGLWRQGHLLFPGRPATGVQTDNSNFDELANYYGVTAVCAVNDRGVRSRYSEEGANLWVCAPSSDNNRGRRAITTTTIRNLYTERFGGTSAAAPIVSGVAALLREANPDLTWRDLKLILAASARKNDTTNSGWETGAKQYGSETETYSFNHEYGFGVVDAAEAVGLVDDWDLVPQMIRTEPVSASPDVTIADLGTTSSTITAGSELEFIEFVEVNITMDAPTFRSLRITLESPSDAVSTLADPLTATELNSYASNGRLPLFGTLRLGSARHLGENPAGDWTLTVTDTLSGYETADLDSWSLTFYGHRETPAAPSIHLVAQGSDALTVHWTAPTYSGTSAVNSYDVRYRTSGDSWTVQDSAWTSGSLRYTISELTGDDSYEVQVRAVNTAGDGSWSGTKTGTVGGTNSAPAFSEGLAAYRTVRENSVVGTGVGSPVRATDTDGDTLTYGLAGPDSGLLTINASTGQISVNSATGLDRETKATLRVTVSVQDGKDPSGAASNAIDDTIEVTITVSDVNEAPRLFSTDRLYRREGTEVVTYFFATDPEYSQLRWSLSGPDGGDFTISEIGTLRFKIRPDFEEPDDANRDNEYELTVRVSDGSLSDTADVRLTITDEQEPPAISGPSSVTFDENSTARVAEYEADDPENDPVDWALRGTDRVLFTINDSGQLSFFQPRDHEAPTDHNEDNVYHVTVNATDGSSNVARDLVVTVANVEEPGMITFSSDQPQVDTPFEAQLTDPDGGLGNIVWKWERSTNRSQWATIAASTSSSHTPTDADLDHYLRVTVTYTDRHSSSTKTLRATSAIKARAAPPVNSPPQFPSTESGTRSVLENRSSGQKVGDPVVATDDDDSSLVYSLGGAHASLFSLDSSTGQLRTRQTFDHEDDSQPSSYQVTVTATDPSSDSDTITVTISVADVNEPPTVEGRTAISYPENGAGLVGTYSADDPEDDELVWTLFGHDAEDLQIGRTSGELRFKTAPDHETPLDSNRDNVYRVSVNGSDGTYSDHKDVTVTVTNLNEPPRIDGPDNVEYAEGRTDVVADFHATDPERQSVTWSLAGSDADDFTIDQNSGVLRFDAAPDHEAPQDDDLDNTYKVQVQAFDTLLSSHSHGVTIEVSNQEEAGRLTLRPALPRVATEFRAELSDPRRRCGRDDLGMGTFHRSVPLDCDQRRGHLELHTRGRRSGTLPARRRLLHRRFGRWKDRHSRLCGSGRPKVSNQHPAPVSPVGNRCQESGREHCQGPQHRPAGGGLRPGERHPYLFAGGRRRLPLFSGRPDRPIADRVPTRLRNTGAVVRGGHRYRSFGGLGQPEPHHQPGRRQRTATSHRPDRCHLTPRTAPAALPCTAPPTPRTPRSTGPCRALTPPI